MTCPTCGSTVKVVSGKEGTNHYEPISAYWSPCGGCKDGHSSFWKTVIESRQWQAWEKDVARRFSKADRSKPVKNVWDVDECRECGWISERHFQAFLKFVKGAKR